MYFGFIHIQATLKFLHSTMKNSSIAISNMIGPVEQMALANHLIQGLYFIASGVRYGTALPKVFLTCTVQYHAGVCSHELVLVGLLVP